MRLVIIIIVLILLVVSLYLYKHFFKDGSKVVNLIKGSDNFTKCDQKITGKSNNFTFSTWIYINAWNKLTCDNTIPIVERFAIKTTPPDATYNFNKQTDCLYALTLGGDDIKTDMFCYVLNSEASSPTYQKIQIPGIAVQKWNHIITTVYNNVMDIYLNGKLVITYPLINTLNMENAGDIYMLSNKCKFNGVVSNVQYFNKYYTPIESWQLYIKGPTEGNWFKNAINRYSMKIEWLVDNNVEWKVNL